MGLLDEMKERMRRCGEYKARGWAPLDDSDENDIKKDLMAPFPPEGDIMKKKRIKEFKKSIRRP